MALRILMSTFRVQNGAPPQRASHWAQQARFEAGIETCYIHQTQQFSKSMRNSAIMSYTPERTGTKKDVSTTLPARQSQGIQRMLQLPWTGPLTSGATGFEPIAIS